MKYFIKLISVVLFTTIVSYPNDLSIDQEISKHATQLFLKSDFDTLTTKARQYLKSKEKTINGTWKLRLLYKGIFDAFNVQIEDEQYWDHLEKKLLAWNTKYPNEPITYNTYASLLYHKAWMYRGLSYTKNVSQKDFQRFHSEANKAKRYLLKHKDLASKDPQWYALMLSIARGIGMDKKEFSDLFDEAIHKYPDYDTLYEFALYYMSPNWFNFSKEKVEKYAKKVLKTSKDKNGAYAKFYMYAKKIIYKETLFYQSDANWTQLKNSFGKLIKSYPTQYNLNQFAYFACLKGDTNTTQKLIDYRITKPILSVWKSRDIYDRCKTLSKNKTSNENNTKVTTIKPNELSEYIQHTTSDKLQVFYFSSYTKNCKVCDIQYFKKIAKQYNGKVDFISVNLYPEKSIFKYPSLFIPYYLPDTPAIMLMFKKKIIRRIFNVDLVARYNDYLKKIDTTIEELNKPGFLKMFKETISDKASFLNSDDEIRFLDPLFLRNKGFKARACSVNLDKNRIVCGQNFSFSSQEEANQLAFERCEKKRAYIGIHDQCRFHRIGDKYVYENDFFNKKKKITSVGFKTISSQKIKPYIFKNSSTKPQYIYFRRENQEIAKGVVQLSKKFKHSVDFLSVEINGDDNDFDATLKQYFGLVRLPTSIVVYRNKIIISFDENHIERFWIDYIEQQLEYLLKNLSNQDYLRHFGKGIHGNYYFAYNAKTRTFYNTKRYLALKKLKAWFVALGNNYSVYGWASGYDNRYALLRKAYLNCKMNSVGHNIPNECNLYMYNDHYTYNDPTSDEILRIKEEFTTQEKLVESLSINKIDEYTQNLSYHKPVLILFGGDKSSHTIVELMAQYYKNKVHFVWTNFDLYNHDTMHKKIQKRFHIKYNRHIAIIYKGEIVLSTTIGPLGGNGNYSRKMIIEQIEKLLGDSSSR